MFTTVTLTYVVKDKLTWLAILIYLDFKVDLIHYSFMKRQISLPSFTWGGGGANGEMANLTNEKGKFAIAIFRHFSPFFAIGSF